MKKKIPRPNWMLEKLYPSSPPPPQQALQTIRNPPPKPLLNPQILSEKPNHKNFVDFLKTHLKPPLSPENLLGFLNKKLRHNPSFAQYDLHVFHWAAEADDTFRHDHSTVEWTARSLSASSRLDELADLLSYFAANPCPCSEGGIFCCPETEPIFGTAIDAFCR